MAKTSKGEATGEGRKVYLNVEIAPDLRWELRKAAAAEHKDLKDWLTDFLRRHLSAGTANAS